MDRVPEPELMDGREQARAYADADFAEPHSLFITLFRQYHPDVKVSHVLDLGCGPADISCRFALAFPDCRIDAVDGAEVMLQLARERLRREDLEQQIDLHQCYLPQDALPADAYDVIISNSLLHHLASPQTLWDAIRMAAGPGSAVFIMDLMRPDNCQRARDFVTDYDAGEPEVLRQDFYHSLLAAYTVPEIRVQLQTAGLDDFSVQEVSDRHWCVVGVMPG